MDRRLGRPLPHQLPNPTRADPSPINLSSLITKMKERIRHYPQFPEAIPKKGARSHALLTRPPLRPKPSSDLHVLSLPPAFVLSQDQTLKLKRLCVPRQSPLHIVSRTTPQTQRPRPSCRTCPSRNTLAGKTGKTAKLTPPSSETTRAPQVADMQEPSV